MLVVCEGEKTEPQYLKGLRVYCRTNLVRLVMEPAAGVPMTIVKRAKQLKDQADADAKMERDSWLKYEQVWCVFDRDEHPKFSEAIEYARQHDLEVAFSIPCFELWLILHFQEPPGLLDRVDAKRRLRQHRPNYDKSVCFKDYADGYRDAVTRAARMYGACVSAGEPERNPNTSVHLLTQEISKYSNCFK